MHTVLTTAGGRMPKIMHTVSLFNSWSFIVYSSSAWVPASGSNFLRRFEAILLLADLSPSSPPPVRSQYSLEILDYILCNTYYSTCTYIFLSSSAHKSY
jgi:hypothetical protein